MRLRKNDKQGRQFAAPKRYTDNIISEYCRLCFGILPTPFWYTGSVLAIAKFPFFGDPEFSIEKKGCERQKRGKNVFAKCSGKNGILLSNFANF